MNAVTRWKTIATIAVAFSAGNLFATACQNAGSGKANAEDAGDGDGDGDGDGSTPPPDVSSLEADVAAIKCVLRYLEDADQDGEISGYVDEEDVGEANRACGI